MAPREKFEFVFVRLSYIPYIHPLYPRITYQLRKHPLTVSITQVRDWYEHVMMRERANLPPDVNIRYCDWRIATGDVSLFTVHGNRFDKIMLVLGEENISWVFYQNMPLQRRIEGSACFPISYCGCCLNNQYLEIMEHIKEMLSRTKVR
ncbi:uncharacterized protein LOC115628706 [Scaptodrosophila lebanonensis]|uniref:Uncharacterized protein LOC115628706 n=1 Tax=Drosophila lebanonensis TaxID=7225 RepID=A0A6J2TYP8_DROLE|nr:uncharacterized protein LOC115628706 [Scaptodrosophila lebanonensis]